MKYKTMMEILDDESLDLSEMHDLMWQYLDEKGMSMEEFMATEEGQIIQEISDRARFAAPTI